MNDWIMSKVWTQEQPGVKCVITTLKGNWQIDLWFRDPAGWTAAATLARGMKEFDGISILEDRSSSVLRLGFSKGISWEGCRRICKSLTQNHIH